MYLFLSGSDSLSSLTVFPATSSVVDSSSLLSLHFLLLLELLLESSCLDFNLLLSENFLSPLVDGFLSTFRLRFSSSVEISRLESFLRDDFFLLSILSNFPCFPELDVEQSMS